MSGEANYFRKRFLGGFNQQDVVDYVSKLAGERNEQREAREKAERELRQLSNELETLRAELEGAKQRCSDHVSKLSLEFDEADKKRLDEILALRDELERTRREAREYRVAALKDAAFALSELEAAFDTVNADIAAAVGRVRAEMEKDGGTDTPDARCDELQSFTDSKEDESDDGFTEPQSDDGAEQTAEPEKGAEESGYPADWAIWGRIQ